MDVPIYFDILFYYYIYVCVPHCYDLSALIGCFWWRFYVVRLLFGFSVGVGVFVTGLSQISSFFSCICILHSRGLEEREASENHIIQN